MLLPLILSFPFSLFCYIVRVVEEPAVYNYQRDLAVSFGWVLLPCPHPAPMGQADLENMRAIAELMALVYSVGASIYFTLTNLVFLLLLRKSDIVLFDIRSTKRTTLGMSDKHAARSAVLAELVGEHEATAIWASEASIAILYAPPLFAAE